MNRLLVDMKLINVIMSYMTVFDFAIMMLTGLSCSKLHLLNCHDWKLSSILKLCLELNVFLVLSNIESKLK